jgi:hypothetical protein
MGKWMEKYYVRMYDISKHFSCTLNTKQIYQRVIVSVKKKKKLRIPKESPNRQNLKCCRLCLIEFVHERYCQAETTTFI